MYNICDKLDEFYFNLKTTFKNGNVKKFYGVRKIVSDMLKQLIDLLIAMQLSSFANLNRFVFGRMFDYL